MSEKIVVKFRDSEAPVQNFPLTYVQFPVQIGLNLSTHDHVFKPSMLFGNTV